jgi:hypothetical protein
MKKPAAYLTDIRTENIWHKLHPFFVNYLNQFTKYAEVEGIAILGGAADTPGRRFLDEFSDLDAALFITLPMPKNIQYSNVREFIDKYQSLLPNWLPPFETHIYCPLHPKDMVEINIHQQIMELEENSQRSWDYDEGRKEGYSETCEILFDRNGRVAKLITDKTKWDDVIARRLLLKLIGQAYWYGTVNPIRQIQRGFIHNGHDLLNRALDILVHIIYLINRKYRPHKKWRLQHALNLSVLPIDFKSRVISAMLIQEMTGKSVQKRVDIFKLLLTDVVALSRNVYDLPEDCYRQSCLESYDDRQLRIK